MKTPEPALCARIFSVLAIVFLLLGPHGAVGDEFRDAVKAYNSQDYQTAVRIWRSYAAKGNVEAQYFLGVAYHKGHGVNQSLNQTIAWFRKAAQGGHPTAMFNLGAAYWKGIGVRQNLGRAVDWWKKSAVEGEASAQYNLASCYLSGKGTEHNLQKAYYWINLAAAQKHPGADKVALIIKQEAKRSGLTLTEVSKDTTAQDSPTRDPINPATESGFSAATVGVRGAVVHLSKPTSNAITKLSSGTPIKVISTRDKWSQVHIPVDINVWVFGTLIAQNGDTARVVGEGVRARTRPSTQSGSSVIGNFEKGEYVRVLSTSGDWKRVTAPRTMRAWILSEQLEIHPSVTEQWINRWQSAAARVNSGETTENTAIDISPSSDSSQTSALFRAALVTQPNTHVLSRPDASGAVIALLDPNTPIKIIGSKGNWKMIQSPNGLDVWVWGKFIDERGATALVNRDRVRIRSRPSTAETSDVLGVLDNGTKVTVVGREGDWARLRIFGAVSGWIDSAQVMTLPTVSDDWRARWASAQALATR